jgi:ATP-binding cassette, subfamily B, bacterial
MADTSDQADLQAAIPSARLESVTRLNPDGRAPSTLASYWRLQTGSPWRWAAIWVCQNIRYLPVYAIPLLTGYLIDLIDPSNPSKVFANLPWVLALTGVLCIGNVTCTTIAKVLLSRINRTMTAGLRRALLRRLNRLAFAYHDRSQQGALQNKFTLDMGRLEGFQNFLSESVLMAGTTILVMLVIVASTNPLLLLVIGLTVPCNLTIARLLWRRIRRSNEEFRVAETAFMANLNETLTGLRISRAHATEEFSEERLSQAAVAVARKGMRLDFVNNLFSSSAWAVSTFLNMAVLGIGVWLAVTQTVTVPLGEWNIIIKPISIGELTVLMSYYGIIAGSVGTILGGLPSVAAAGDAIASLSQLFAAEDAEPNANKRSVTSVAGDIKLQQVRFRYPEARAHSLDGLDLHVPAGTSMALVGPSGSGKSTIASLVLGFYSPEAGQVLIDDQDLGELDRRSLRRHVGVVSQEVVLFQDTILGNIAWGDRKPDEVRARVAAARANAMEFIERMPGGIHHVLGDRGQGLSGGQRQRLAIARALYRDPKLLILDEATSALDPESERLVQQALDVLMKGRSTLIIAHRLSTVRSADRIAVIKAGRVVELGGYDELMAKDGEFRHLAQGQLG